MFKQKFCQVENPDLLGHSVVTASTVLVHYTKVEVDNINIHKRDPSTYLMYHKENKNYPEERTLQLVVQFSNFLE